MAQAPTPGQVKARTADELSVTIRVDGVGYTLYPQMLTAKDAAAVRAQAGVSVRRLIEQVQEDPDIDVIAALVWVARCQAGESVALADVSAAISYESEFGEVTTDEAALPDDHPSS